MTGPGRDDIRDTLAAALAESRDWFESWDDLPEVLREQFRLTADALLPVVRRIAADELRAAADEIQATADGRRARVQAYLATVPPSKRLRARSRKDGHEIGTALRIAKKLTTRADGLDPR